MRTGPRPHLLRGGISMNQYNMLFQNLREMVHNNEPKNDIIGLIRNILLENLEGGQMFWRRSIQEAINLLDAVEVANMAPYIDALDRNLRDRLFPRMPGIFDPNYGAGKTRGLKGKGLRPDNNILQQIAQQSYHQNPNSTIGNFTLLHRTPTLVFYKGPDNTIIVGVRGTDKTDTRDLRADSMIAIGNLENSDRFKQDLRDVEEFQRSYPRNEFDYYGTGHSLGGAIVDLFLKKGLIKTARTYNPAIQPQDLKNNDIANDRAFISTDPLYALAKPFLTKDPEVRDLKRDSLWSQLRNYIPIVGQISDKLDSHGLKHFEGGKEKPMHKLGMSERVVGGKKDGKPSIFDSKKLPQNYSEDAVRIIKAMAFGPDIKVLGSMSLRSQPFAGDYDMYEVVNVKGPVAEAVVALRKRFQQMVKNILKMDDVFIGDVKAGSVEEWRVIPKTVTIIDGRVKGYDYPQSKKILDRLISNDLLSEDEKKEALKLLPKKMGYKEYYDAKGFFKFHILRWKAEDILKNELKLRNGATITLEQAFQCPTISKMDLISYVQNSRYTDFSCLYEFRVNGKVINPDPIDIIPALKADIGYYSLVGKPFKALKRKFALSKVEGDEETALALQPILNSDLGRLYFITGDFGTLVNLLKQPKTDAKRIEIELDQFRYRMSNIWTIEDFLRDEPILLKEIQRIISLPKEKMAKPLEAMEDKLNKILQDATKIAIKSLRKG